MARQAPPSASAATSTRSDTTRSSPRWPSPCTWRRSSSRRRSRGRAHSATSTCGCASSVKVWSPPPRSGRAVSAPIASRRPPRPIPRCGRTSGSAASASAPARSRRRRRRCRCRRRRPRRPPPSKPPRAASAPCCRRSLSARCSVRWPSFRAAPSASKGSTRRSLVWERGTLLAWWLGEVASRRRALFGRHLHHRVRPHLPL